MRVGEMELEDREVAAGAGVDPALVHRFFGGKEELFTKVASALIDPASALTAVADAIADPAAGAEAGARHAQQAFAVAV